ncbi:MAG: metalloregulator ArsR/SmtB family transcription factor [Lapillicoccus sp.]
MAAGTPGAGRGNGVTPARLKVGAGSVVHPDRVAHVRDRLPTAEDAGRLASLLSIMAEPIRLRLLYALDLTQELCVGDLALALGASEDQATYGLRLLRTAGLVVSRKEGRSVLYRLAEDFPEPLREHCLRQLIDLTRHAADLDEAQS